MRKAWNDALGVPSKLMDDVIGNFRRRHILKGDVFALLCGEFKRLKNGARDYERAGENGEKVKVRVYHYAKYVPQDKASWDNMLSDSRYAQVETIPNASQRVVGIIRKWEDANNA